MDLLGVDYPYSTSALTGKHALVCGASKGIGASTAKMLAKAGADVTVCARNEHALQQLCAEMEALGNGKHHSLVLDLEDTESLNPAVSELIEQRGTIHILVNNAGGPPGGPLIENSVSDFDAPFKRHLHASHILTQLVIPGMESTGYGRIVQIISTFQISDFQIRSEVLWPRGRRVCRESCTPASQSTMSYRALPILNV